MRLSRKEAAASYLSHGAESIRVMCPLFQAEEGGNTASRMLAWMTRDIRKTFQKVENLISYQDCEVHTGGIYAAAGWKRTVQSKDHRDRGLRLGRLRNRSQTTATKQRWEKKLCD